MKILILKYLVLYGTNVTALRNEAKYVNTQVLADLFSQEYVLNHLVLKHMVCFLSKIFIILLFTLVITITLVCIFCCFCFVHSQDPNYKTLTIEIYCSVRTSPGILYHTAV